MSFVIDFLIAVVVGGITAILATPMLGFLIGIATLFAVEMLRIRILVDKIKTQYEVVISMKNALEPNDKFGEIALVYGLRYYGKLAKSFVSVDKDHIWDFWRDCMIRAYNKWDVLTYTTSEETWNSGWSKKTLSIQSERIVDGCVIERIFLVESQEERNKLQEIINQKKEIGIKVSWLLKDDLLANKAARNYYNNIGSLDFAIIDNTWIYMTRLDSQRQMIGACATKDPEIVEKAKLLLIEAKGLVNTKKTSL